MEMESHTFDKLDLQLVAALELDARAPFSRIAAVLGVSDQTIARRFRRLSAEGGLRVVAVRDAERLGQSQWMLRLRCAPDSAETIAEALAKRPDTAWIGLASGGTEVVCMTRPRSPGDHDDLLLGKLPRTPSIMEIRAHQILNRFFGGPTGWISRFDALTDEQIAALRPRLPDPSGPVRIDPEDEPLVAALERDGRATYPELQRATGRSESVVKRRLAALLASGAVYVDVEYHAETLGYACAAVLWITAAPAALHSVGEALATHDEIAFAAATAGPSNIVVTAVARDTAGLYAYLSGRLGTLEGVQHVETTPFLRRIKQLTYARPTR
ncbi:Lrp/AsnC family transcriptional regulator [Streptomyces olivochromogenes]|uniref:Transcriptional regulator n=1 Tax=Streptomyces olivochromogenes TaxID=1963 RepID=A0A250V3M8_STROL|nr:Lrp/AsnC family transcriptional regulator [Streptomyces olivochromogenes]KUN49009.1 AsnC family transcriptional regulator [Streptomyces olivochromogenes]GAX48702.1 transcriptional regulator [Streptomyces olivochromogenes]